MTKVTRIRSSWRVNEETVERISDLVNIRLSEEEASLFTKQLSGILDYFRKIDEVDTRDVEPTFHALDLKNIVREDKVSASLPNRVALENAPRKENGLFKAPKIL
jgi:aspartyl-tRNA(Asn)/glutamyl-tRNA(Gln) amidotransferase subunit C